MSSHPYHASDTHPLTDLTVANPPPATATCQPPGTNLASTILPQTPLTLSTNTIRVHKG